MLAIQNKNYYSSFEVSFCRDLWVAEFSLDFFGDCYLEFFYVCE